MDFSDAQTLMGTSKTFAMYAGAVICLGGLILKIASALPQPLGSSAQPDPSAKKPDELLR